MKKISFPELKSMMLQFNTDHPKDLETPKLSAVIVYKQSNWKKEYSEESRSYRVWNNNRMFQPGMFANSLCGCCLDGTDQGVRLDQYDWKVDYCYIESSDTTTIRDLKKGDFFTKKPIASPTERQVWIRGEYDRSGKKYECTRFDDINTVCYMAGTKEVYTGFTF